MRKIETVKAEHSASHALTLMHHIEADQLDAMLTIYKTMVRYIEAAITGRDTANEQADKVHIRVVEAKAFYDRQCIQLRRLRRRGASVRGISRMTGYSIMVLREMIKHGNALARAALADEKKALIIRLYRQGVGPRPAARIVAARFGRCSPAYVAKIVKGYLHAMQPELPLSVLRRIK